MVTVTHSVVYCLAYSDVNCEPTPEEGMPLRDYLQMKFGEGAAEHFLSGQSPIAQHGKAVVGSCSITL